MSTVMRAMLAGLCLLLGLGVGSADAKVEISSYSITAFNVVGERATQLHPSAARALGFTRVIVGVSPAGPGNPASNARGFTVATPMLGQPTVNVPALEVPADVGWLEPWDVNGAGVFVGQARAASRDAPRYAFRNSTNGPPYDPLVAGMKDPAQWAGSAATAINEQGVVVGWGQRRSATEQAFYWTAAGGLKNISIEGASRSWAESITKDGLVGGYYEKGGERRGFVFDIASGSVTDFGPVVVPVERAWLYDFHNVSINTDGVVAAAHAVNSGSATVNQAFVWEGSATTPILPVSGFRDSFAAGISDTGWVVGILRAADGLGQTGFLWYGGQTLDLSFELQGSDWLSIDAVYDVYSQLTDDPLVQTGILVGMGTYRDPLTGVTQQRAFSMQVTLQVPEPHIYVMLGIGLLAIGALRIRRQPH